MKNKNLFLCLTSFLIVFPLYFFGKIKNKKNSEIICAFFLLLIFTTSILFWVNPIQHSFFHKLDAFIVRISILYILFYVFFVKYKHIKLFLYLFCISFLFYFYGHKYSNIKWCCDEHFIFHGIFHIFCYFSCIFLFI